VDVKARPSTYQQDDGSSGSHRRNVREADDEETGAAAAAGSGFRARLAEVPHVVSAFGLWAPVYVTVFTGACFILAFAVGRHTGPESVACDGGLHMLLLSSAAALFLWMIIFMVRDVREQRRASVDNSGTQHLRHAIAWIRTLIAVSRSVLVRLLCFKLGL